ncbi:hypothetical protein [Stenotrophomonas indicatrix]|uniref:hypothetical protein n=2 Tax=Stenotrophomonas indicatrix TaxID=2045451 RepID=UPI0013D9563C|nr:hypothetical protein [Stenotrophomonas indicatrix]
MTSLVLALVVAMGASAEPPQVRDCSYDRAAMLAMEPGMFDQDMDGGWRSLADRGCNQQAADLLAAYAALPKASGNTTIVWHEGQLRAELGQTAQAIALMQRTYKPEDKDPGYWNAYVDGTIAFLRRDRAALEQARAALVAIPTPQEFVGALKDGRYHFTTAGGQKVDVPWPPNLEILDGFLRCFDRDYHNAMDNLACRKPEGG